MTITLDAYGNYLAMIGNESDPIPEHFATLEEAAEFWDRHDLADYWDLTEDAGFEVNLKRRRYLVAVAPELAEKLAVEAHRQGILTETLVNLWLSEKLQQKANELPESS